MDNWKREFIHNNESTIKRMKNGNVGGEVQVESKGSVHESAATVVTSRFVATGSVQVDLVT